MTPPKYTEEARLRIFNKLCTVFKIPRNQRQSQDDHATEFLHLPAVDNLLGRQTYFYPVEFRPSSFSMFFSYTKMEKTGLFDLYTKVEQEMEGMGNGWHLLLETIPDGLVWVMKKGYPPEEERAGIWLGSKQQAYYVSPLRFYFGPYLAELAEMED